MAKWNRLWIASGLLLAACQQAGTPSVTAPQYHTAAVVQAVTSDEDRKFLAGAAAGNQSEVTLGQIAVTHCQTAGCRGVGERLVVDHTKGLKATRKLAKQLDVPLSNDACVALQPLAEMLAKLKGLDFDRVYLMAMQDDHEKDIAKFKTEAEKADSAEVRAFAKGMLPTLETHLQLVKDALAAL